MHNPLDVLMCQYAHVLIPEQHMYKINKGERNVFAHPSLAYLHISILAHHPPFTLCIPALAR